MLALVVAVALSQCTKDVECKGDRICSNGVCVETRLVPREASPVVAQLDAQRPGLQWPISSLVAGTIALVLGVILGAVVRDDTWRTTGALIGAGLLFGGGVSLGTTLWARARVGQMMDEAEAR